MICQLLEKLFKWAPLICSSHQNFQFEISWGLNTWGFLEKKLFYILWFSPSAFFCLHNGTYDFEKKRTSSCWCKPQNARDWLYCRGRICHCSASYFCIRGIQLLPIKIRKIRISVCLCCRIVIARFIFSRGLSHQHIYSLDFFLSDVFLQEHLHLRHRNTTRRKPVLICRKFLALKAGPFIV